MRLEQVAAAVRECTACALHKDRTNAVPGEGPPSAEVVLVGEAPGRNEDETGRPFCGAAGRQLDAALAEAGLGREEVFITSIVKCRPPGNRDPRPEEKAACRPHLLAQLAAIRPRVVVALGRHGLSALVAGTPQRFSDVRGSLLAADLGGSRLPVFVSLHPAAVLYRRAWREQYLADWRGFGAWLRGGPVPGERTAEGGSGAP